MIQIACYQFSGCLGRMPGVETSVTASEAFPVIFPRTQTGHRSAASGHKRCGESGEMETSPLLQRECA